MKEPVYWQTVYARFSRRLSFSFSLPLYLSLSRPRVLIVVPSFAFFLSGFRSRSTSNRPVAEREREKERKKEREREREKERRRRARIVASRKSLCVFLVREKNPQCIHRSCPSVSPLPPLDSSRLSLSSPHHTSLYLSSPRLASPRSTPWYSLDSPSFGSLCLASASSPRILLCSFLFVTS